MAKRTLVGVDLGTYSIKCVVLDEDKQMYQPRFKNEYFISDYNSVGFPSSELENMLIDFVSRHRIQSPAFCFSLPCMSPYVLTQIFTMPKVSLKEVSHGVRYEMQERSLIDDVDTYHYQWEVLDTFKETYRILGVAIHKDVLSVLRKIKRPGWSILSIEPQVISLGRVIGGNAAVLDMGHSGTGLFIYKGGKPCHIQSIEIGGKVFSEIIEREYPDEPESVNLKHFNCAVLLGHPEIESDATMLHLSSLIESSVRELAVELKRSLRAVEASEGFSVEGVYFIGNGARLRYLPEYLSSELEHELIPISLTDRGMDVFGDYNYTVAGGAWLFKDYPYLKEINFIKTPSRISLPVLTALPDINLSGLLFVLLSAGIMLNLAMFDLSRRVNARYTELAGWERELGGEIDYLNTEIRKLNMENKSYVLIDYINNIPKLQRTYVSDVLYQLPLSVPENIMLKHISLDPKEGKINLYGSSLDYSGIGFFAIDLERNFSNPKGEVAIKSYNKSGDIYTFEIEMSLRP